MAAGGIRWRTPAFIQTMMDAKHVTPSPPADLGTALHQRLIHDVLTDSRHLMEHIAEAARQSLRAREDLARTAGEHQAMLEARQRLSQLAPVMCERYPTALRNALDQAIAQKQKSTRALSSIHFDDLELMDETQISESVERARAQQMLAAAVDGPLADFDALMSAAQGLTTVRPDHNPLRPEVFLQALQSVVAQMQTTNQVRHDWMGHLAQALGNELRKLYLALIERLRQGDVRPVGFAMRQSNGKYVYLAPAEGNIAPGFGPEKEEDAPQAAQADARLTLDRLRRLLLGELTDAPAPTPAPQDDFAERFSREFESPGAFPALEPPSTDFAATVPAAFEALQEMNQVDHMMQRLGEQRAQPGGAAGYAALRQHPGGLGQALSMEVVALMVDNIARDERLLWPVQQFIRTLEPALLQLALADPRFFSHKDHPARRLLQEITDRSLAFPHTKASGFDSFMQSLLQIAGSLATADIDGQAPFVRILEELQAAWAESEQARERERQRAIEALQHAEQRHLLAAQMSREIWLLPQMDKVPGEISRFLLGPWVKVMAQARLTDPTGNADPGRYRETVDALLWSAQPELTRANTSQLARLVPKLLSKLREGLASIDYPPAQTHAFFDLLMQLHQEAFRPAAPRPPQPTQPPAATGTAPSRPALPPDDEPWIAPSEAKESGFMDVAPDPQAPPATNDTDGAPKAAPLDIGTWVNLRVNGQWERMQLSWIGPHNTLFLFTGASGRTQSMPLRLLNRLIEQGTMQVLTQQKVVDSALDAVAQAAMRNSLDSTL